MAKQRVAWERESESESDQPSLSLLLAESQRKEQERLDKMTPEERESWEKISREVSHRDKMETVKDRIIHGGILLLIVLLIIGLLYFFFAII